MLIYYVYAYLRKKDLTPYYIGKGTGNRAYDKDHKVKVPEDRSRIIIIENNLTELGAFALERRLIRWYGRKDIGTGILRNITDGGEGTSGYKPTLEERIKRGAAIKNSPNNDVRRQKISEALKGRIRSEDHCRKISESAKGRKHSAEAKQKISDAQKFRLPVSDETRKKLSEARKKRPPLSEEAREKIRESNRRRAKKFGC